MDEKDWKLLLTLHEQGSITKASERLYVTQPALSTRLRLIEEYFGVQAVIRGKKGVQFTAEGEYLVKKAQEALAALEETRDTLDGMRHATAGTLRIGASHFLTRYILPSLLRDFKARNQAVEFRVRTGWTNELIREVLDNTIHLALIREDHNWAGIKRLLFSENMLVVYSQKFAIRELPTLPLIRFTNEPSHQLLIDNWWAERFSSNPLVGMVVDRLDTCLEMVKKGLGYGFLPAWIMHGHTELFARTMRDQSGKAVERSTWLVLKEETAKLRVVKEFLDMVEEVDFPSYLA